MGKIHINPETLPPIDPEPNYVIKTRPPIPMEWSLNILRGKREEELSDEAFRLARRKCYKSVMRFIQCEKQKGMFWSVFDCQEEWDICSRCMDHELSLIHI
eukprot:TRINITY_DN20478_c0_g1_i2.p1 TRINITY_DN20478_c0_g1~~TRINITY_DN20478_c0_g1_i2.p1  ORF type:complete len:101 (+),score=10.10 TRINITY_DN20478_c0_g1_i2:62-364(+)